MTFLCLQKISTSLQTVVDTTEKLWVCFTRQLILKL